MRKESSSPGAPLWLVTFSDLITLCLTFFVLLYSFSTLDANKWKAVTASLQGALGPFSSGTKPMDGEIIVEIEDYENGSPETNLLKEYQQYQAETIKLNNIQVQLADFVNKEGLGQFISIMMEERGLVLRFEDSVLFMKGKADILEQSLDILAKTIEILINVDNPIRIEGHTDDLAINTLRFPSNWELSTGRATNVLRIFLERGMNPERLSAVGYGEYHPVAPNDSEENRRKNRRVDIVIIRGDLKFNEPK